MTARGWNDGWYTVPMEVTFRDIDYFGHVNNAVFFSYFEWGRTQLWFELTGSREPGEIGFIVARAECDFREQIGMETIEVRTRISEMGTTSMTFLSEIRKEASQQLAATGKVVAVLFDWKTRKKMAIPADFREKIEQLQR